MSEEVKAERVEASIASPMQREHAKPLIKYRFRFQFLKNEQISAHVFDRRPVNDSAVFMQRLSKRTPNRENSRVALIQEIHVESWLGGHRQNTISGGGGVELTIVISVPASVTELQLDAELQRTTKGLHMRYARLQVVGDEEMRR